MSAVASPAAEALAEDLATVLLDGGGDDDRTARVDVVLADALTALESMAGRSEVADAAVALAVGLLADVRAGHLDHLACRVAAPLVIDRLVRAVGEHEVTGALAPALVVLGALAVVPEAGGASSALDPSRDPALPLEVALAAFVADPGRRGELLDVLAAEVVHVPVLHAAVDGDHLALRLVPLVLRDGPVACAFTSAARCQEVATEAGRLDLATLEVTGAELVELWPARHGLALNPGSVLGAVLTEREVRALPTRLP